MSRTFKEGNIAHRAGFGVDSGFISIVSQQIGSGIALYDLDDVL